MEGLLQDETALMYGAGGGLGRGIARTFAREGANVVLAGRTRDSFKGAASNRAAGMTARVANVTCGLVPT